jgi:hypothetical protein
VIYALASGAYSYVVLTFLARFVGNVFRNFTPEWAFIPEYGVALMIFRSRIRLLVNFMKLVYLDKKDRVHAWLRSRRSVLAMAAVLILLLLPVRHESTAGSFVLEPAHPTVRANPWPRCATSRSCPVPLKPKPNTLSPPIARRRRHSSITTSGWPRRSATGSPRDLNS